MFDYHIHRARRSNWKRIRALRLRSLADAPDAFAKSLAEERELPEVEWRRRCEKKSVAQFLATAAAGDIGLAVGAPYVSKYQAAGLFGMWVAPEARQQGVGAALIRAVVAWAEGERYQRVVLDVAQANAAAIRLYQSCGFAATGIQGTLPPPREHVRQIQMEKRLE